MTGLTNEEKEFVKRVGETKKYGRGGSFVLSPSNRIYHGIPFKGARCIHGEENAIGAMVTEEGIKSKFKAILIVGAQNEIIMPCGMCREAIRRCGVRNATVLCSNKSLTKIERYTIRQLYPSPCDEKWL